MSLKHYATIALILVLSALIITVIAQRSSIEKLNDKNKQLSAQIESINKSIANLEELREQLGEVTSKTIIIEQKVRELPDEGLEDAANGLSTEIFERFSK